MELNSEPAGAENTRKDRVPSSNSFSSYWNFSPSRTIRRKKFNLNKLCSTLNTYWRHLVTTTNQSAEKAEALLRDKKAKVMRSCVSNAIYSSTSSKKRKTASSVSASKLILQPDASSYSVVPPTTVSPADLLGKYREKRIDSVDSVASSSSSKSYSEHAGEISNPASPVFESQENPASVQSGEATSACFWNHCSGFDSLEYFKSIHHCWRNQFISIEQRIKTKPNQKTWKITL